VSRLGLRSTRSLLLLVLLVVLLVGAATGVPVALPAVAALVGIVLLSPLLGELARRAAWALPALVAIAVLLVDFGGRSNAPGPLRYAPTVLVVLTVFLVGVSSDRRSRLLRITALALFAYGVVGTLYGRFALGTINGALPLVGPMVIACLPPVRSWEVGDGWRTGLRVLAAAGGVFALFSGLTRLGVLPLAQLDVVNHEKSFVFVLAIGAAWAARDRLLLVGVLAATAFAFTAYPAATYALAGLVAVGTVLLSRLRPDGPSRVLLALGAGASVLLATMYVDRLIELSDVYFQFVGKQDNGSARAALYSAALERLDHPWLSSLFTGDITVVGNLTGELVVVPVHNDYLSITLGGGIVAAALLLSVFLSANGLVIRALRAGLPDDQRRTVVVLLATLNAAAVSAFANPVFMNPGASALVFGILAALVAACRPVRDDRLAHDPTAVTGATAVATPPRVP
jgi:hypothetical protein